MKPSSLLAAIACALLSVWSGRAADKKPNILVIMGDDIGWFNPSCYNRGMMGFQTPNIDRVAKEGAMFMTWYGQQSCTELKKVGIPGVDTEANLLRVPNGACLIARRCYWPKPEALDGRWTPPQITCAQ